MRISVVVPVYNLQNELEKCVSSILKQTYRNLEILLVDDGSTDESRNVIKRLAELDERIVPVFQANGGVTSARLAGVKKARGEWIGFVDGDDVIEPDMYERLLTNAKKHEADISHCGYQSVFSDGRINCFYGTGRVVEQDRITGIKDLLEGAFIEPSLCNKVFRRELFQALFSKDMATSIRINEDLLMNYYLFSAAECAVFEDVCKYHYLVRAESASRKKLDEHRVMDPVRVRQTILDDCEAELKDTAMRVYLRTCIYSYNSVLWSGEFRRLREQLRELLVEQKASLMLLPPKQRLMAEMIVHIPGAYAAVYLVYEKLFQKKRYR